MKRLANGVSESSTGAETATTTTAATPTEAAAPQATDDVSQVSHATLPYGATAKSAGSEIGIRAPWPVALLLLKHLPKHAAVEHPGQELSKQNTDHRVVFEYGACPVVAAALELASQGLQLEQAFLLLFE
jgi:hypothetical protein